MLGRQVAYQMSLAQQLCLPQLRPAARFLCVALQTWPSSVVLNWVRAIRHFAANDTAPLNVTTVNTADIKSTLRVPMLDARPLAALIHICQRSSKQVWVRACVGPHMPGSRGIAQAVGEG